MYNYLPYQKLFDGLGKTAVKYEINLRNDSQTLAITTPRRLSIPRLETVITDL